MQRVSFTTNVLATRDGAKEIWCGRAYNMKTVTVSNKFNSGELIFVRSVSCLPHD